MRSPAIAMAFASGCSLVNGIEVTAPPTANGSAAPFALADQRGQTVALEQLLSAGDVVMVFYRGHW